MAGAPRPRTERHRPRLLPRSTRSKQFASEASPLSCCTQKPARPHALSLADADLYTPEGREQDPPQPSPSLAHDDYIPPADRMPLDAEVASIAAPIFNPDGTMRFAISLAPGSAYRVRDLPGPLARRTTCSRPRDNENRRTPTPSRLPPTSRDAQLDRATYGRERGRLSLGVLWGSAPVHEGRGLRVQSGRPRMVRRIGLAPAALREVVGQDPVLTWQLLARPVDDHQPIRDRPALAPPLKPIHIA